jgi:DNA-directed RNA polymerase
MARWWLAEGRLTRALIKRPVMTFPYGVTEQGAKDQIVSEYKRTHGWEDGLSDRARYLARHVRQVSVELLPRAAAAMQYIRKLADHCASRGEPLRWYSHTGLPIANRYYKSNAKTVELPLRGVRARYRVADSWSPEILKHEARNAAPANFVHSRDAAHLIRAVNGAAREGIINVVCVHDCFGTIAPRSQRFQNILRTQLVLMYMGRLVRYASSGEGLGLRGLAPPEDPRWRQPPSLSHNPLAQLRAWNAGDDYPMPPQQGTLDPLSVQRAEYAFQ